MRTREEYSLEQRKKWKDRDMAESSIAQEKLPPREIVLLSVTEITATEYNRTKNKKGADIPKVTPSYFVVRDGESLTTYVTSGGKFYKSYGYALPEQDELLLSNTKLTIPHVAIHISMAVVGSKWDDTRKSAA